MGIYIKYNRVILSLFILLILFLLPSCKKQEIPKICVGDDFYYWESSLESTLGDAIKNENSFKKLEDDSVYNLINTFGQGKHFVWLRADFEIPLNLKNQPLGLVIPHLSFAEQLYCNGVFISQYGSFPPNEQSTLYKAHFFSFPTSVLKQNEKNTIFIKVYVQGLSGISTHAFVSPARFAYPEFERINFWNTRIYIFFIGVFFFSFVLYMGFYFNLKSFKEFRDFGILNLLTSIFIVYFFATELPFYTNGTIPFLPFVKATFYIPSYFIIYFATLFALDYMNIKISKGIKITRNVIIAIQTILTVLSPSYNHFMYLAPFILTLLLTQTIIGLVVIIRNLKGKGSRRLCLQFLTGISPFIFTTFFDISIRIIDNSRAYPFFSVFGWQATIIVFIIILALRFSKAYKSNEQLSSHLKEEVSSRTRELQTANTELSTLNKRLEKYKVRSEMDLEMASLVQRKFLPKPNVKFRGWDIAVCYSPQAKVSGDFFDYYSFNETLNGITLFDVSGHGLSASLVTMLSKNIISRVFQTGFRRKETVDKILNKINNLILVEKGDIENYMTGILCRFNYLDSDEGCSIEIGNAGHPYPLLYDSQKNETCEVKGNDGKKHYGAIGMKGIQVSFARSTLQISKGDIILFYTDGLTEASNSKQEQFGNSRVKELLKDNHDKSSEEILKILTENLESFMENKSNEDDLTIIIAKRTDPGEYDSSADAEDDFEELEELEELTDE